MEDPAMEIEGVIQALVDHPTLQRQKETLEKYFTEDVLFFHFYFNSTSRKSLTAIYQMAEFMFNYSGVESHSILYDAAANALAVRMTVYVRPWFLLMRRTPLQLHSLLELEDVVVDGRKVKKIRVQRDYFIRSPTMLLIPVVAELYDSDFLRFIVGNTLALFDQYFIWLLGFVWRGASKASVL